MGKLSEILRSFGDGTVAFWCPGCNEPHGVKVLIGGWNWNKRVDLPTFSPSILVTGGHYVPGHQGDCWCTYNQKHPEAPVAFKCMRCHSYVRDGQIQFLGDSTHALAGQTVPLPPWPEIDKG